jgi:CPA2 family monovalent cation:H+ antiporter-2
MGLCFMMAVFSVKCGFSLELGAFVMGSILAGTMAAERMEHVVKPVKDLFGAVFFISVGMMVDPTTIVAYWGEILLLAVVVICGMIFFGTVGMLLTGQSLKVAMESGFSLTQIGEFSFIIASLGMSLGVLKPSLYPIIVAVSVITIFTTPYFIKLSQPAYRFVERHLPKGLNFLIERYSKQVVDDNETRQLWKALISRYLWRLVLYSVILIAIIMLSRRLLYPLSKVWFNEWGNLIATGLTLGAMSPFLVALCYNSSNQKERIKLHATASFYDVPLVALRIVRYLVALMFVVNIVSLAYTSTIGWTVGVSVVVLAIVVASTKIKHRYEGIEKTFMDNLNIRENTRLGLNNNLVSDMHQAYIEVGPYCSFVGDKLKDSGLRRDYGVSISSIQRGQIMMPLPTKDARIFPGDILGVIGTDDQIKRLNDDIEAERIAYEKLSPKNTEVAFCSIRLSSTSPLINRPLSEISLRTDYYSIVVTVHRENNNEFIQPEPTTVLREGDLIWVVGDPSQLEKMKGVQTT